MSGSSATVTWTAPDTDGGSPITGYTVTASSDSATATVDGGTHTATLTGLAHAATDTFSVTAANTAGSSDPAASGPASQVLTGTVKAPSGAPVACGTVTIETSDLPTAGAASWTPTTIGTVVTGSDGTWSFPVPSYASLPAAAQQAATNNNGMLNLDTSASGYAAAGGHTYDEAALGYTSAWVGTATQATPGGPTTPAAMATTMQPLIVTDQSALDTAANELSSSATANNPLATTAVTPDTSNPTGASSRATRQTLTQPRLQAPRRASSTASGEVITTSITVPSGFSATDMKAFWRRTGASAAVLLPTLLAAACTATTGQRTVFPDATGTSSTMHMSTDEITDIGFEPFDNISGDPVRLRSVSFVSPPDALRVLNVRAYDYKHTRDVPVGGAGDLAKECPHLYEPRPPGSYVTPPHGASSWFVVTAFTISKPGRYYLGKVRVDYTARGHPGWQYIAIDTTMIIANPPDPGPTPEPSSAVCG